MDLIAWLAVILLWALWGTRLHWCEGLWFEFKPGSWPMRTWYKKWGGTTFGHGGPLRPGGAGGAGIDTAIEKHEHVHVEQYEASMLASFLIAIAVAITGSFALACSIWVSGGFLYYMCSIIQALLRGENPYTGSHLEESAYSQGWCDWRKKEDEEEGSKKEWKER
jgi:hypothetical protein